MVQVARVREIDLQAREITGVGELHSNVAGLAVNHNRAGVGIRREIDCFHPWDFAIFQVIQHRLPVQRGAVGKAYLDRAARCCVVLFAAGTQLSRRASIGVLKHRVEATHTAEACREAHVGQGQAGFVDEFLRKMQALGLYDRHRRRTHVLLEQASQLPRPNRQLGGKRVHRACVQHPLRDQLQGSGHLVWRADPGRCTR